MAEPNLIVLTGDMVSVNIKKIKEEMKILKTLKAKDGVFAILGNRDLCCNEEIELIQEFKNININILKNDVHALKYFDLIGIDDSNNIDVSYLNNKITKKSIFLAHQPKSVTLIDNIKDIELMLCGHTHGGQILPFGAIMLKRQKQPYLRGLHKYKKSDIYVNSGAGHTKIPIRFLTRGEISHIVINS